MAFYAVCVTSLILSQFRTVIRTHVNKPAAFYILLDILFLVYKFE